MSDVDVVSKSRDKDEIIRERAAELWGWFTGKKGKVERIPVDDVLQSVAAGLSKVVEGQKAKDGKSLLERRYDEPDNGVIAQNVRYLLQRFKSVEDVAKFLQEFEKSAESGGVNKFLWDVFEGSSNSARRVVALVTKSLLDNPYRPEDKPDEPFREYRGWFKETVEDASVVWRNIDLFFKFFDGLIDKQSKKRKDKRPQLLQLKNFLDVVKRSLRCIVPDCLNLANCFAIHVQQEDCAVFTSSLAFPKPTPLQIKAVTDLGIYNIFNEISSHILKDPERKNPRSKKSVGVDGTTDGKEEKDPVVCVPCYLGVKDIKLFLKSFCKFFSAFFQGFRGLSAIQVDNNTDSNRRVIGKRIKFGSLATIIVNAVSGSKKQARISFLMEENGFKDYGFRIDLDRHGLCLDFGGVDFEKALSLARLVGERSKGKTVIDSYSGVITNSGHFKNNQSGEYVPSIMDLEMGPGAANFLALKERAALFVSLAMETGASIGTRPGKSLSYHFPDPELGLYEDQFSYLADGLIDLLQSL